MDIISTLPRSIIETILCLMPITDAVRTSILSKKWRYNWVKIPKLVFDEKQLYLVIRYEDDPFRGMFHRIFQILLVHHGPILEFSLYVTLCDSFEIDQIMLYLLRNNTVKKFLLHNDAYKLPSSFFSLNQLTHLNLQFCKLSPPSTFTGFGCLTSLHLENVHTSTKSILFLLSGCPLLKSFTLMQIESECVFKRDSDSTIIELFGCLPSIDHLCMNDFAIECFAIGVVPQKLPTSLTHLKYFHKIGMEMSMHAFAYSILFMRSSPNLEKLKIEIYRNERSQEIIEPQDYSDVCLEHLTELEIKNFANFITELEIVKLILVKSPVLKRVHIEVHHTFSNEGDLLTTLQSHPRASPVVQIIVKRPHFSDEIKHSLGFYF